MGAQSGFLSVRPCWTRNIKGDNDSSTGAVCAATDTGCPNGCEPYPPAMEGLHGAVYGHINRVTQRIGTPGYLLGGDEACVAWSCNVRPVHHSTLGTRVEQAPRGEGVELSGSCPMGSAHARVDLLCLRHSPIRSTLTIEPGRGTRCPSPPDPASEGGPLTRAFSVVSGFILIRPIVTQPVPPLMSKPPGIGSVLILRLSTFA